VNLSGAVPERTLLRLAKDLQDRLEALEPVLEAQLTGHRDEMLEVVIDPLRLEAYNVTATELISVVVNNNQLIAAGEIETASAAPSRSRSRPPSATSATSTPCRSRPRATASSRWAIWPTSA
jgi:multidrug efflux pump subunit AcrB